MLHFPVLLNPGLGGMKDFPVLLNPGLGGMKDFPVLLNPGLGGMKDDAFSSIAQPGTRGHEGCCIFQYCSTRN